MTDRIYLFDTTLRDGAQTQGVDFSVADKYAIAQALDHIGIDYVEGGWPGANPTDDSFFGAPPELENAALVAFGMTRRPGRSADNDPGLAPILNSPAKAACLVGKSWDFHVDVALEIDHDENIAMIADSIRLASQRKAEAMYDAEHFFDGYKANPEFALACVKAAYDAGARWIVLCDTNGGTLPDEVERIVGEVTQHIPGDRLGIHAHNDTENAVANSLAAVRAGVRQVQGTINGLGERCGNANICSLIPSLMLKMGYRTGLTEDGLKGLTELSRLLDERLERPSNRHQAYVGDAAFSHKGGLHVSAVAKDPRTYEHIPPETVGNRRHIVVSDQAGRSNIVARLEENGIEMEEKALRRLLEDIKEREFLGYAYDGADASFELLAYHAKGEVPDYFDISRFRVMDERRHNAVGKLITESEATVQVDLKGRQIMRVAMGNGPVNALDTALREAVLEIYPDLSSMQLVDYKVRILPPPKGSTGTDAVTRVSIESEDDEGHRWTTVGVSPNIIDASVIALYDAYAYKLMRDGVRMTGQGTPPTGGNERQALGRRILDTCRAMNATGINQGKSGNVSARFGDGMLITPTGVSYDAMKPMDMVYVTLDGEPIGNDQLLPSSEWRMHGDIYRHRAEAQAVVHAHPTHCAALACLRRGIPAFHYMVAVAGGRDIRCSNYATFGTEDLSHTMIAALDGRKACLLANHGMICFDTDLDRALGLAVEVESLARQYHAALQVGEPVLLDDAEMDRVLVKFKTYGKQPNREE